MKIRNVKLSDINAIAAIHYECWMKTYSGILPEKYLQSLTLASFEKRWTNGMTVNDDVIRLVSLENSQPIGFIVGLENRFPEKCPEAMVKSGPYTLIQIIGQKDTAKNFLSNLKEH